MYILNHNSSETKIILALSDFNSVLCIDINISKTSEMFYMNLIYHHGLDKHKTDLRCLWVQY
jgi:hypothetical protein